MNADERGSEQSEGTAADVILSAAKDLVADARSFTALWMTRLTVDSAFPDL
jgi:hypothetical protein